MQAPPPPLRPALPSGAPDLRAARSPLPRSRYWPILLAGIATVALHGGCGDNKKNQVFPSDYLTSNNTELACAGPGTGKLTVTGSPTLEFSGSPAGLGGAGGAGTATPTAGTSAQAGSAGKAGATHSPGYGVTRGGAAALEGASVSCTSPWAAGVSAANSPCSFFLRISEQDTALTSGSHQLGSLSLASWSCADHTTRLTLDLAKQAATIPDDSSFDLVMRAPKGTVRSQALSAWSESTLLRLERTGQSTCEAIPEGTLELTLEDTVGACSDAPCLTPNGFRRVVSARVTLSAPACGIQSLELTGKVSWG